MAVWFQHVLRVSLFATPIILLLLLLMPHFCRRYSARLRCFVWIMLMAHLLIPVHFSLGTSLWDALPLDTLLDWIDENAVAAAFMDILSNENTTVLSEQARPSFALNWRLVGLVWFAGMIVFLCCNIMAYHVTVKRLQRWSTPVTDPVLLKAFDEAKARLSISRDIGLYQAGDTAPPMIVGFMRPRIYIPAKPIAAAGFRDMITHELWHYKRKDLWFKLALLLSNAVHWFNPVVFFMLRQVELDIEMACDNDVLRDATPFMRKQYGLTILSCFEDTSSLSTPLTTSFLGGKKQMKLRFSSIISPNKKKSGAAFAAVIALLVILCGSLAGSLFAVSPDSPVGPADSPETGKLQDSHGNGEMAWPVPGFYSISSQYGTRHQSSDFHMGIDISGKNISGASVIAAEAGTVAAAVKNYKGGVGYGQHVIIAHEDNMRTMYAQLDSVLVKAGDKVKKGQAIGTAGSTGFANEPHLHFEVREGTESVNPVTYLTSVEASK